MSGRRFGWVVAVLSLSSLALGCAAQVPAQAGVAQADCRKQEVPVVPQDAKPVLLAQLPAEFFPVDAPWPTLPRVALVPLDLSKVRQTSVRSWTTPTLEERVNPPFVNEKSKGLLRGVLFAKPGDPKGPVSTYVFGGEGKPRPIYFLEPPRSQKPPESHVLRDHKRETLDGRTLYLDLAMVSPGEGKRFPLEQWVHLVDVEVNHGHGEAYSPNFAVTKLRVLDGTEVLPLDLAAAASVLDERAQSSIVAASKRAEPLVQKAEKKLPADARLVTRTPGIRSRMAIAWDGKRKELTFTYLHENVSVTYQGPTRNLPTNCALGEPCRPRAETPVYTVQFAVGVRQTLSASGALVEETTFEPQVTTAKSMH